MKCKYNKFQMSGFIIASLLLLSGCHSDNDAVEDELTATYVYLQRVDYLSPSPKTYRIDVRVNIELRDAKASNVGLELHD